MTSIDHPHTGVGWAFPIRWTRNTDTAAGSPASLVGEGEPSVTVRAETAAGVDKVRQAMTLIILTDLGERRMRPRFGSGANEFVFDTMSSSAIAQLGHRVERALKIFEPRILLDRIDTIPAPDDGRVDIVVEFRMDRHRRPTSLVVPFYPHGGVS